MIPKRLIAFSLFAALAFAPAGSLRAQWVPTNGPFGSYVDCAAISGSNLFVATNNGIYRSTNNGQTWAASNNGLPTNSFCNAYALAASGPNIFVSLYPDGVFRSTDNGLTWGDANNGLPQDNSPIARFAVSGTHLFATTGQGIFRTTDNGTSWKVVMISLTDTANGVIAANGSNLYVGTSTPSHVFHSTDDGNSWSAEKGGLTGKEIQDFAFMEANVFALVNVAWPNLTSILVSTDAGANWTTTNSGTIDSTIFAMAVIGSNLFAEGRNGVFLTNDNGAHWSRPNNSGWPGIPRSLSFPHPLVANESQLFAGTTFGMYISSDSGGSWIESNSGFPYARNLNNLTQIGTTLFAGTYELGAYRSKDDGASWRQCNTGLNLEWIDVLAFAAIGADIFAGTQDGVYHSSDDGMNWEPDTTGLNTGITSLVVMGSNLFAGSNRGVHLSTDQGRSWNGVNNGLTDTNVFAMVVGGSNLFVKSWTGLFHSTDSGKTWTRLKNLPDTNVSSLVTIGTNLFLGTSDIFNAAGIFRSTDNGLSWTAANKGLNLPYALVGALTAIGTNLFVATLDGVYVSNDSGNNWIPVNTGLSSNCFVTLFAANQSYIFAGVADSGVWRRPLSELIPQNAGTELPALKHELRTYPNPFSQSTTISFTPETSGHAEVSVVNLLGVEVARIFSGVLDAGEHTFTWNPEGLSDEIYECLVRMNGRVEALPVMLLR